MRAIALLLALAAAAASVAQPASPELTEGTPAVSPTPQQQQQQQQPPSPLPPSSWDQSAPGGGSSPANTSGETINGSSTTSSRQEPLRTFEALPYEASPAASGPCCDRLRGLNFSSNLPVIVVELGDVARVSGASAGALTLEQKGPALPGKLCTCGGETDFQDISLHIRVRGSSSAVDYAKKSFRVETVEQSANLTEDSKDQKIKLLGFPSDNRWVFHGPENDRTLGMRNWLAYWASRQMGRYASRTRFFELFINLADGSPLSLDDYRGVYQLQESTGRGKARVDIAKLDFAVDPSGGYILAYENDNVAGTAPAVFTRLTNLAIVVDYPGSPTQQELRWLTNWLNAFESRLLQQPVDQLGDVFDLPAAIDYFLLTELTKNPDGYRGSVRMHKDAGGPMVMGPPWDYNEAFGMCCGFPIEGYKSGGQSNGTSGGSAISPSGWRFNICADQARCRADKLDGISQWYRKMWEDPSFRTGAAARWQQLRGTSGPLADAKFVAEIARLKEILLKGAGLRNWQRWAAVLNNPTYGPAYGDFAATFEGETDFLQRWTLAHLAWLDAALARQADASAGPLAYLGPAPTAAPPAPAASPVPTVSSAPAASPVLAVSPAPAASPTPAASPVGGTAGGNEAVAPASAG